MNRFLQSSLLAFWAAYFAVQSRALGFGTVRPAGRTGASLDIAALAFLIGAGLFAVAFLLFVAGRAEERREAQSLIELASAGLVLAGTATSMAAGDAQAVSWLYPVLPALLLTLFIVRSAHDEAGTMQPEMPANRAAAVSARGAAFDVALASISGRARAR